MKLTTLEIAQMIDVSAVRAEHGKSDIRELAAFAAQHQCYLITTLPVHCRLARSLLGQESVVGLGGNVGFPSGGQTKTIQIAETRELVQMGCTEIDTVVNIGLLTSGGYAEAKDDLAAIVEAAQGLPVKAIVECHYLDESQIRRACDVCIEAGAAFIKTGTGWAPTGATPDNVALIKAHAGDAIAIKASGGVRGLEMVVELYRRGARRFGIGLHWASKILEQCEALPGGQIEF